MFESCSISGSPDPVSPITSVALITNGAYSIANFRGPLVRALVDRGIRVHALAPDFDDKTRDAVRRLGAEPIDIAMERAGTQPFREFINVVRLFFVLRRLRPESTFCYFIKPVIYGNLVARAAGVKHRYSLIAGLGYIFGDSVNSPKRKVLQWIVSLLCRCGLSACDRVFFQNEDDIDLFVKAGLIKPEKALRVNGTGVDLQQLSPQPPVESPRTFLLMARLLREKGIAEFAAAARLVLTKYPEARFVLLGGLDPNPGGLSQSDVETWVREGVIEWHGHIDDVRPWIAHASVYVLPSYYREGVPRSTQEAMAMARPIITTNWVGCRDTVVDGVNGFLVPVRDSEALARAMIRFIENPALIGSMGQESRRLAEERFDVHRINAVMLEAMGI